MLLLTPTCFLNILQFWNMSTCPCPRFFPRSSISIFAELWLFKKQFPSLAVRQHDEYSIYSLVESWGFDKFSFCHSSLKQQQKKDSCYVVIYMLWIVLMVRTMHILYTWVLAYNAHTCDSVTFPYFCVLLCDLPCLLLSAFRAVRYWGQYSKESWFCGWQYLQD